MKKLQSKAAIMPIFLIGAIFMFGCAVNKEKIMESGINSVEQRAKFDMECEEVSSTMLGEMIEGYSNANNSSFHEMNIGVSGCDRKATYLTRCVPAPNSTGTGDVVCKAVLNNITNNINININDGDKKEDSSQGDEQ